jgi:hypothetical protein
MNAIVSNRLKKRGLGPRATTLQLVMKGAGSQSCGCQYVGQKALFVRSHLCMLVRFHPLRKSILLLHAMPRKAYTFPDRFLQYIR